MGVTPSKEQTNLSYGKKELGIEYRQQNVGHDVLHKTSHIPSLEGFGFRQQNIGQETSQIPLKEGLSQQNIGQEASRIPPLERLPQQNVGQEASRIPPKEGLSAVKNSTTLELDNLKRRCSELIIEHENNIQSGEQYVYKICSGHIVILKFLSDTKTNEERKDVINPSHAKFRADRLFVVAIINIHNLQTFDEIRNNNFQLKIIYKINQIVIPDKFDLDIDNVCSSGIHYFRTIDTAYYYRTMKKDFTGNWICFRDDGTMESESELLKGQSNGYYKKYYTNGNICLEGKIFNNIRTGRWYFWHKNGIMESDCDYYHGKLIGRSISWHDNGKKASEGVYVDGNDLNDIRDGKWNFWYDNEIKSYECEYINGKEHGKSIALHKNGNIRYCCEYENGKIIGNCTEYDENGKIIWNKY